jgi:hypothetical protein
MQVVEPFENASDFRVLAIDETKNKVTASSEKLFGSKSLQLDYDMTDDSPVHVAPNEFNTVTFTQGDTLGIHVWGDMSYNDLIVRFNVPDTWTFINVPLGRIDFHGWRYMSVPVDKLGEPARFASLVLAHHPEESMCKTGTIRFDNLLKKASSGIDEARLAGMKVKVAGDYIVVSADTWVQGVELIDINGRTIKGTGSNCLNVADVASGVYLVRVHINGQTATQKVAIR